VLFFQTEEEVVPFLTNWEKIGFVMPTTLGLALVVGVFVLQPDWGARLKATALALVALGLYVLVRYLAICGWMIEFVDLKGQTGTNPMWAFAGPWRTLLSFMPCAFLLAKLRLVPVLPAACDSSTPSLPSGWRLPRPSPD